MAKVIGKIEALVGEVKILGVDGVLRDATVGEAIHAGEQIVSTDPGAQFEVKYLALEETSIYEGIFRVLADGSVIAGVDAMESIIGDEALMGLLETAAGEEGADGSSAYIPNDAIAESSVQGFSRGENQESGNNDDSDGDDNLIIDTNDFEPTAQDGTNVATEDDLADVTGQLVGADLDGDAFEFVLVDGLGEDEGRLTLNPDGSYIYNVDGDFQDLRIGETRDVTFTYKTVETTTPEGYESEPATVTITVTGTNDQPIVEDIDVNGEQTWLIGASTIPQGGENQGENGGYYDIDGASLEDINALFSVGEDSVVVDDLDPENGEDYNPIDGAAMKFIMDVEAGESITFNWTFNDAEGYDEGEGEDGFRDFAFVVVDGVSIELLADTFEDGTTNTGTFTYTFQDGGQHEITFGVMNDDDEIVDSSLEISHISGGNIVDTQSVGHVENIGNDAIIYETHDTIDITGEDDTQGEDGNNILTGTLSVFDLDTNDVNDINDTHIFEVVGEVSIVNPENVDITAGREGEEVDVKVSITFNEDTQEWEYKIDGDFSELAAGETSTLTFDYVAIDNSHDNIADYIGDNVDDQPAPNESDTSDAKTITLTITGTNDQPVVNNIALDAIDESHDAIDYANGVDDTSFTDSGSDEFTTFTGTLANLDGTLTGETLNIQDDDTNDTHTYHLSGDVIVVDTTSQDTAEDNTIQDLGITATVELDETTGEYTISGNFNALAHGESATVTFSYYVEDSSLTQANGESNESEIKTVTLTVNGTNDQPVVEHVDANEEVVLVDADGFEPGTDISNAFDGMTLSSENGGSIYSALAHSGVSSTGSNIFNDNSTTNATSNTFGVMRIDFDNDASKISVDFISDDNSDTGRLRIYDENDVLIDSVSTGVFGPSGEIITLTLSGNGTNIAYAILDDADIGLVNFDNIKVTFNNTVYETHDNNAYQNGIDDTSSETDIGTDEFTTFDGNLATVSDDDTNDTHTYYIDGAYDTQAQGTAIPANVVDSTSGNLGITATVIITDAVAGDYTISGNFNALAAGETATVTFDYVAVDSSGEDDESAMSEPKTVTLVITGTNDQPVAQAQTYGDTDAGQAAIYETHDSDAYQNGEDDTSSETDIGTDGTTTLSGTLSASDDDTNDTHIFNVENMMGEDSLHTNYVNAQYYDGYNQGGDSVVIKIESDDIEVSNITLDSLTLLDNDGGADRSTDFSLIGNFNALAAGETATVTFMYTADDQMGYGGEDANNEMSTSEPKLVTITITGTNDQPIITEIDTRTANETELASVSYGADIDVSLTDVDVDPFTAEGSAIKVVLDTAAGETVSFDWVFDLRDWDYMQDAAFVVVDGVVTTLADGSIDANGTFEFTFATAGEHTIVIGVLNNHDNQDYSGSSLLAITNTNGGELISSETFGAVSVNANGYDMSANSDLSAAELDAFIDLQEVTYENAHLSGNLDLEERVDVSDDDNNDDYTYVEFSDRIVDFTESHDDSSDINLITTPIRVSLDADGNYDVISSSFDKLGEGDSVTITFDIQVRDTSGVDDNGDVNNEAAVSEPKTVTIIINGTNDSPEIISIDTIDAIIEPELTTDFGNENYYNIIGHADLLNKITISDEDTNDSHTLELTNRTVEYDGGLYSPDVTFVFNPDDAGDINPLNGQNSGILQVTQDFLDYYTHIDAEIGDFLFYGDGLNNMGLGETATITFNIVANDDTLGLNGGESNLSAPFTVTINVLGTNDQPTVTNVEISGLEVLGDANTTFNGTFVGEDEDTNDSLTYGVVSMDVNTNVENIAGNDYVRVEDVPYDADGDGVYESYVDIAVRLESGSEVNLDDVDFTGIKITGNTFAVEGDFNTLPVDEVMSVKFLYNATDDSGAIVNPGDESAVSDNAMVTLTITGTNDDAVITTPVGQDAGEVAEDIILAVDGQLLIADLDAGEAEFIPDTQTSTYGEFVITASGAWEYTLDNDAAQAIGNEVVTETFTVSSEDGTDTQDVVITIHGQNDPVIITSAVDTGSVEEDVTLSDSGTVEFSDVDLTDVHTVSSARTLQETDYSTTMGTFVAVKTTDTTGTGTGGVATWTYTLGVAAQELAAGQSVTETYTISIDDNNGDIITQDVVITITGTNDAPEIQVVDVEGSITEGSVLTDNGSITFTDVDLTDTPVATEATVSVTTNGLALTAGQEAAIEDAFSIDETITNANNGEVTWNYTITEGELDFLADGDEVTATFTITVADGNGGVDAQNVTVIITGTNDVPTVTAETASVFEDSTVSGTVAFDDIDGDATVTVDGTTPTGLTLNPNGTYTFDAESYDYLADGEELVIVVPLIVTDGIAYVPTTLTITVTGTNDTPTVTSEVLSGGVTEDSLPLTATGDIVLEDLDLLDVYDVNVAANTNLGILTAVVTTVGEARTVTWDYAVNNADVQYLVDGEVKTETFTLTITSDNGDVVTKDVTVTINGADDVAVITYDLPSDIAQDVYEDNPSYLVTGELNISDLDAGQDEFAPDTQTSTYGEFIISASGAWQYTLDNDAAQVLGDEVVTETFTVWSKDGGTPQVITISINGSDDTPVVTYSTNTSSLTLDNTNNFIASGVTITGYENDGSVVTPTVTGSGLLGITGQINENSTGSEAVVFDFDQNYDSATFELSHFYDSSALVDSVPLFNIYDQKDGTVLWTAYRDGTEIDSGTFTAPDNSGTNSFAITTVEPFDSLRIEPEVNNWMNNNFYIKSLNVESSDDVMHISDVDGGDVDLSSLTSLTSVDAIELTGTTEINISVADVIDITDGDNELIISSSDDVNDKITLDGFGSGVDNGNGTHTYTGSVGGETAIITIEDTITVD